jgi:hypothetical protein
MIESGQVAVKIGSSGKQKSTLKTVQSAGYARIMEFALSSPVTIPPQS